MSFKVSMGNVFKKHSFSILLSFAFGVGIVATLLGFDRNTIIAVVSALGVLCLVLGWKFTSNRQDSGAWQRQIDREYRLDISGSTLTLYRNEVQEMRFEWRNVTEIQMLSRRGSFPPLFWRIISQDGEFTVPNGGSYAREFEKKFIYALPGYYDQMVVKVAIPPNYTDATSMWRENDPHPKRQRSDDDDTW